MHRSSVLFASAAGLLVAACQGAPKPEPPAPASTAGFAAVAGEKGGQDQTGPYEVVTDWPKPLSQLPGHEKWTWGAVQGIFAESPNRVFILERGELPKLERPEEVPYPKVGPSISFPVSQTPFRNASVGPAQQPRQRRAATAGTDGRESWASTRGGSTACSSSTPTATSPRTGRSGTRCSAGRTPSPSTPTIPRSTSGSSRTATTRLQVHQRRQSSWCRRSASRACSGTDNTHFNRPTFLAWLPDSTMYVSDGYANTRVVKFDKDGKFLMHVGREGHRRRTTRGRERSTRSMACRSIRRRARSTSPIVRATASRCSTRTASSSISSAPANPSTPQVLFLAADKNLWIADNTRRRS